MIHRLISAAGAAVFGYVAARMWYSIVFETSFDDPWMIILFPVALCVLAIVCGITWFAAICLWQVFRP